MSVLRSKIFISKGIDCSQLIQQRERITGKKYRLGALQSISKRRVKNTMQQDACLNSVNIII